MKVNQYAIITGAANGLGKAFAYELANRKVNLILIDLPNTGLPELSEKLEKEYGIKSSFFKCDLSQYEAVLNLIEEINNNYDIYILINNVGIGGSKRIDQVDSMYINKIIQLNVMSTSVLTHGLLPNLRKQEKAYILNVSSMVAFCPVGYKTVYPASKAFIYSLSRGLSEELTETNVSVSVVTPGPMPTNEDCKKRIRVQGPFAQVGILGPERVAELSITQLFKRKKLILLNYPNKLNYLIAKLLPSSMWLSPITKIIKKETELPEARIINNHEPVTLEPKESYVKNQS